MSDDSNVYLVLMNMPDEWGNKHLKFTVQEKSIPEATKCICYHIPKGSRVEIKHETTPIASGFRITDENSVKVDCQGIEMIGDVPPASVCAITLFKNHPISLSLIITTSTAIHFSLSPRRPDPVGCGE